MKLRRVAAGHYEHEDGVHAVCENTAGFWYVSIVRTRGERPQPLTLYGRIDGRFTSPTKRGAAAVLAWELAKGRAAS